MGDVQFDNKMFSNIKPINGNYCDSIKSFLKSFVKINYTVRQLDFVFQSMYGQKENKLKALPINNYAIQMHNVGYNQRHTQLETMHKNYTVTHNFGDWFTISKKYLRACDAFINADIVKMIGTA